MKKIILSLIIVGAVAVAVTTATQALFSDIETSFDNTFATGTLDLTVGGENDPNVVHITYEDLAPCDGTGGAEHSTVQYQWTLANVGSIVGQPWIEITNLEDRDNDCNDPESDVDSTCGDPGLTEGELSDNLFMQINAAGSGGFEYPHGTGCIDSGRNCPLSYWAGHGPIGQGTWENIPGSSSIAPMVLGFEVACDVGNIIQSDSAEFDIVFHLDQVTP